jgi:hypothetical protein
MCANTMEASMPQRGNHARMLARLKLMYQDAHRSAELCAQKADALQRRIITVRSGYRRAARVTLQATLAEQTAHKRLAAQAEQNLADLAQRVAEDDAHAGNH